LRRIDNPSQTVTVAIFSQKRDNFGIQQIVNPIFIEHMAQIVAELDLEAVLGHDEKDQHPTNGLSQQRGVARLGSHLPLIEQ